MQSDITIKQNNFHDLTARGIYFENVVDSEIKRNDLTNIAQTGIQLNGGNENVDDQTQRSYQPWHVRTCTGFCSATPKKSIRIPITSSSAITSLALG